MPSDRTLSGASPGVSRRVELARVALAGALAVDGVVAGNAGPAAIHVTAGGETRLEGVVVAAERGGRYGVDLYLTAELVQFQELGERVAERVRKDVEEAGMVELLGALQVTIADVEVKGAT